MNKFPVQIRVFINNISAERLWEIGKAIPPVKIATNVNILGINKKDSIRKSYLELIADKFKNKMKI